MSSRRPHRKSRLGCKCCKLRKLKCDEVHPACGNCVKRDEPCDFTLAACSQAVQKLEPVMIPSLQRGHKPEGRLVKNTSINMDSIHTSTLQSALIEAPPLLENQKQKNQQPALHLPTTIGTPVDRLLELKLLHHYLNLESPTRPSHPRYIPEIKMQVSWKEWIVSLAMTDHTLMDAILGFSASHLREMSPCDRHMYQTSYRYVLRAITGHTEQLRRGINSQNVEVIFATSSFVQLYCGMDSSARICGPPLHWFHPFQGMAAIVGAGFGTMLRSRIASLLALDWDLLPSYTDFRYTPQVGLSLPFDFLLSALRFEDHDPDTIKTYQYAVTCLNLLDTATVMREVMRFPAMVPRRFVELVAAEDPRALTIVGYFFMLLGRNHSPWWLRRRLKSDFIALIKLLPEEWRPKMDWAVREFGHANLDLAGRLALRA